MNQPFRTVRAKFFGAAPRELLGSVHAAHGGTVRDTGVVLCYPAPQEYRMVHWTFCRLAERLAATGYNVLRFDYFATGDSAGNSVDGSIAQWEADTLTAAAYLRDETGMRRLSLVGMRLGATLAWRAVERGLVVQDIVMWDPVIGGAAYLRELERADARLLGEQPYPVPGTPPNAELLGYPLVPAMRADVNAINLLAGTRARPRRLLVLASTSHPEHHAFVEHAREQGIVATYERVDDPPLYDERADAVETLIAHAATDAVLTFLAERSA